MIIGTAIAAVLIAGPPPQATPRSPRARAEFMRLHACPATGKRRGPCPGYVVDHIRPLCAGGPDTPANMQWQTVTDAREKDKAEHAECRARRQMKMQ